MKSTLPEEVLEEISEATGNLEMIKKNKDHAPVILSWLLCLLCELWPRKWAFSQKVWHPGSQVLWGGVSAA